MFSSQLRSVFSFLFLSFCLLSFVSPHNWLGDLGRSQLASTRFPWPPKVSTTPHIQVGTNQTFQVSWSVGHGNILTLFNDRVYSYFIIFHADDQDKVPISPTLLRSAIAQYIKEAPGRANLTGPIWVKNQLLPALVTNRNQPNPSFYDNFNDTIDIYFDQMINKTHPRWIPRDPVQMANCKREAFQYCSNSIPATQWLYKDRELDLDARLEYFNPNLPWIESLHRFQTSVTQTTFTNTYTTANFKIPGRRGPGNYMVWFIWRGYYDVIDVIIIFHFNFLFYFFNFFDTHFIFFLFISLF